jgi:hypothetical protein
MSILNTRTPIEVLIESPFLAAMRQAREFDPFLFAGHGPAIAKSYIINVSRPRGGTGKLPPALAALFSTSTKHASPTP